jgi:S1-C subfamily serine protease
MLWAFLGGLVVMTFLNRSGGRDWLASLGSTKPPAVPVEPRPVVARGELAQDERSTVELFQRTSPAVVYITTVARRGVGLFDVMEVPQGTGSGFLWDADGHVVTNFHVIQGASGARVTLHDGSEWAAVLVGTAPDQDLAVLQIRAADRKLTPIMVGASRDLRVGQKVFAIGNPFGLDFTLTTGIVSALGRTIPALTGRRIEDVIQTDAAINPGNSGGPLLDSAGRLIGVNTQIASPSGTSAGIGFAVPVDTVNRVVPQLLEHGKIVRPRLGIVPAQEWVLRRAGVEGVLILQVAEGSGAAKAGLRGTKRDDQGALVLGDVIQSIDGHPVGSLDDVYAQLERFKAGDTVPVGILRNGEAQSVDVTLDPA